jgi:hypothetical protein
VPAGGYHIVGNQILDSAGRRFIVKGNDAVYGRFAGGDTNGFGLHNYNNAQRDLDNLKLAGANLIRLSVSQYHYANGPLTPAEYTAEIDNVVTWITQSPSWRRVTRTTRWSGSSPTTNRAVSAVTGASVTTGHTGRPPRRHSSRPSGPQGTQSRSS